MAHLEHLRWPFFASHHGAPALKADAWAAANITDAHGGDVDGACRTLVAQLGAAGWMRHAVPGE
jgi:acyl-CoA dehydrogenase